MSCQGCVIHNFYTYTHVYMYPWSVTHPVFPGGVWAHNEMSAVVIVDTATLQLRERRNRIREGWSLASVATVTETAISPKTKIKSRLFISIILIRWIMLPQQDSVLLWCLWSHAIVQSVHWRGPEMGRGPTGQKILSACGSDTVPWDIPTDPTPAHM